LSKGKIIHCPTADCIGIFELKNPFCEECKKIFCKKCKQESHKGKCEKIQFSLGLGNIHRCPNCAETFEKISGCPHMSCRTCRHGWCWVCGSDLKSWFHTKIMEPGCQMINLFVLHEKIPNFLRYFLALICMAIAPPIVSFIAMLAISNEYLIKVLDLRKPYSWKRKSEVEKSRRDRCIDILFCIRAKRSCCQRFFQTVAIAFPFWLIYWTLLVSVVLVAWVVMLVPAYLYSVFALLKCMVWWCKNKRVGTHQLTER
jgi:hypothetical protein